MPPPIRPGSPQAPKIPASEIAPTPATRSTPEVGAPVSGDTWSPRDTAGAPVRNEVATGIASPIERIAGAEGIPSSESLEAPLRELESLVDASTGVSFRKRSWDRLSSEEKTHLKTLGHDGASWDAFRGGDLSRFPATFGVAFQDLSGAQKEAVSGLGLDEASWNSERALHLDIQENKDIRTTFVDLLKKGGVITEADVRQKLIPAARDWGVETQSEKRALLYLVDFHGHRFSESARRAVRDDLNRHNALDQVAGGFKSFGWNASIAPESEKAWKADANGEPIVVNDASGMSPTLVRDLVRVTSPADVRAALSQARLEGIPVSIAGRRHSMGGQTTAPGGIQLDMLGMNRMSLAPDGKTLKVEAGATWAQVQQYLVQHGRAVKVMQTSNIFTVGGSLSVNCHGRTPGEPPLANFVKSVRVMTANGEVKTCSRTENPDLFRHVLGGYGLFGVVLDAELETTEDVPCRMDVEVIKAEDYPKHFAEALKDPTVQLAYGRLNPTLKGDALLHVVRKDDSVEMGKGFSATENRFTTLGKAALEASKLGPEALEVRWWLEKMGKGKATTASLNSFMSPNVDLLRQFWFNEGKKTDILHEYFIPREGYQAFVDGLREVQERNGMNTVNLTLRDVAKDEDTALPYAKKDAFAFVLYFNQELTAEGNQKQEALTRDLIDLANRCGGTFYLPYQLHYTPEQLRQSYPEVDAFFAEKKRLDPEGLFNNAFFEKYGPKS